MTRPDRDSEMPVLLLLMGVSGSGKSTLAKKWSQLHPFYYLDADDFHSEQSIAMMREGIPLTDSIREAWIGRINQRLSELCAAHQNVVLAFSGLKQRYREQIWDIGFRRFACLIEVDRSELQRRLQQRKNHFFNPQLLDSQRATLEQPASNENIFTPGPAPTDELLEMIAQQIFKRRACHAD